MPPALVMPARIVTVPRKAELVPDWCAWLMLYLYGRTYSRVRIGGAVMNIMAPHTTPEGEELCTPLAAASTPAWWSTTPNLTQLCVYLGIPTVDLVVNDANYSFQVAYYQGLGRQPGLEQLVRGPPAMVPQPFTLTMPRHFRTKPDEIATRLAQVYTGLTEPWHRVYFGTAECVHVLKHGDWPAYACGLTDC